MADKKVSELDAAATIAGTELVPVVQGAATKKGTVNGILRALQYLADLTPAADRLPYFSGSGTGALATFTAAARTLLAAPSAQAQRNVLSAYGREMGYAESSAGGFSTATTSWVNNKISGLSVTVVGTGQAVEIQWWFGQLRMTASNWGIVGLIVNGAVDQPMIFYSASTSLGEKKDCVRRMVLSDGVSYTFELGWQVQSGATATWGGAVTNLAWLSVTER